MIVTQTSQDRVTYVKRPHGYFARFIQMLS